MIGTNGLKTVSSEALKRLLRAVHREELPCPFDRIGLASTGLLGHADELGLLHGLDKKAVQAVIVAVLAERRRR